MTERQGPKELVGESLRFAKESLFHAVLCDSLQQCTVYNQATLAESEQPKSPCDGEINASSGLCPECFTCISLCDSMWMTPM